MAPLKLIYALKKGITMKVTGLLLSLFLVVGFLQNCGDDSSSREAPTTGQPTVIAMTDFSGAMLFFNRHTDTVSSYTCNSCHSLTDPDPDSMHRPGNPVGNAFNRASFKNGDFTSLIQAVNSCREEWMTAPQWSENDPVWKELESFLQEQAEDQGSQTISYSIKTTTPTIVDGDMDAGREFFNSSCSICHGTNGVNGFAPSIAGSSLTPQQIYTKIRTSGQEDIDIYPGLTGGRMPFYSEERITDTQIMDVITFVKNAEAMETVIVDSKDLSLAGAQTNCGSTSSKIGQTLSFSTLSHRVSGIARIVDDCTIQLEDFNFDGGGVDIRVYTGSISSSSGRFEESSNPSISVNLLNQEFVNGNATVRLPAGVNINDIDALSIWCVPFGISFGHGGFN